MNLTAFAPAKVNLFLHVGPLEPSGFHPVSSLMTFADVGDTISVSPADHLSFDLDGPFCGALDGDASDNLVMRAARGLLARARGPTPPFRLLLTKRLPVAAGLGGGSSDAGAALRLLSKTLGQTIDPEILLEIAAEIGSDGPACLKGAPVLAEGRGERLYPAPHMPLVDGVLVNPGAPCPTGPVYRAFDTLGGGSADRPPMPEAFADAQDLAAFLSFCRNDLEPPAIKIAPVINETLELLRGEPETLIARLSGSGATCFALCSSHIEAEGLADRVASLRPGWWVAPCRFGGPWPD